MENGHAPQGAASAVSSRPDVAALAAALKWVFTASIVDVQAALDGVACHRVTRNIAMVCAEHVQESISSDIPLDAQLALIAAHERSMAFDPEATLPSAPAIAIGEAL